MSNNYLQPVNDHFGYNNVRLEDVDDDIFLNNSRSRTPMSDEGAVGGGYKRSTNPFDEDPLDYQRQILEDRRRRIEARSLESTQKSLGLLYETEEVGKATAAELAKQREQLERTAKQLDDINASLRFSQRHLNGLKSVFGGLKNYLSGNREQQQPPANATPSTSRAASGSQTYQPAGDNDKDYSAASTSRAASGSQTYQPAGNNYKDYSAASTSRTVSGSRTYQPAGDNYKDYSAASTSRAASGSRTYQPAGDNYNDYSAAGTSRAASGSHTYQDASDNYKPTNSMSNFVQNTKSSTDRYDNHPISRLRDDSSMQQQQQIRHNPFEAQLEANLEEMCGNLSRLKCLATDLGQEIETQNEFLDNMNYRMEDVDIKLSKQNKDIHKLLGRK